MPSDHNQPRHPVSSGDPSFQRLFRFGDNRFVLIAKSGLAVAFQIDPGGTVHVAERMENVDFKATGRLLIQSGWRCVGPGLMYASLLTEPDASAPGLKPWAILITQSCGNLPGVTSF